ncbi:aldo/keto reductase [Streptomyces viridosporus]|uniref:Aldo/keto reductase n=1 Tax=Streptomyces viridosporus T7A TaxID=665577 RepID=A0ABX6A6T7_STRVD|nr:aldo/keto reductase [Streptomyces viridosporus]QEU83418.1 aldo/keto reductase [Streptomyces viridosporus T7A]
MTAFDLTRRHLGRGLFVHPLGVNCGAIGLSQGTESETDDGRFLDGLRRAVELGANLLDTADSYGAGRAERMLGRLLREYPNNGLLVSSKVGRIRGSAPHAYADRHIHHQFQQTQENLYVEELDLYVLDSWDFGPQDRYLGTAIDQMQTLRELGAIKAIGMRGPYTHYGATSEERTACVQRFLYLFRLIKPNVVWTRFNGLTPAIQVEGESLFDFTARHGAGVILSAPLAHGLLTGKTVPSSMPRLGPRDNPASARILAPAALDTIAAGLQELRAHFGDAPGTLTRLALLSSLQQADHCTAVVGFTSEAQIQENFECLNGPALTADELGLLDEIFARIRTELERTSQGRPAHEARV